MSTRILHTIMIFVLGAGFVAAQSESVQSRPASVPATESRPESAPSSAPSSAPAVSIVTAPEAGASHPASRPADPRFAEVDARRAKLLEAERTLQQGSRIETSLLEEIFSLPPYGAEQQTQKLRNDIITLEDQWMSTRKAREEAVQEIHRRAALAAGQALKESFGPKPHPLAVPDPMRLAVVCIRRREYVRALEYLETVTGPDARYLEGCALDGLDRLDEAIAAFQRAKAEATNNPRLLASITRRSQLTDWRGQIGRPEDLTAPLRRAPLADVIQAAIDASARLELLNQQSGIAPKAREAQTK